MEDIKSKLKKHLEYKFKEVKLKFYDRQYEKKINREIYFGSENPVKITYYEIDHKEFGTLTEICTGYGVSKEGLEKNYDEGMNKIFKGLMRFIKMTNPKLISINVEEENECINLKLCCYCPEDV
jgi:hypothetical protein